MNDEVPISQIISFDSGETLRTTETVTAGTTHTITPITSLAVTTHIAPGTLVTLKQGGPAMVVMARTANEAFVAWHNDTGDLFEKMLPVIALKVKQP